MNTNPPSGLNLGATESLRRALQERIQGEVRFDSLTRALYATDASVYQIMPAGVVIPRRAADVVEVIRQCAHHAIPITPRGAGTAIGGQAIGPGVILDFSKYLNRILDVDVGEQWAWVEPGIVLDELNQSLARFGLHFAPDVATSNRATLGGMIGNNSAGARSLVYGKTSDHILELDVAMSDGRVVRMGELDAAAFDAKCRDATLEGHCYRTVRQLARDYAAEIERRYPKIMRRVGGYNLDEFLPGRPFNLARMMIGSEGTLGVVVAAKIRLTPLPRARVLLVVHFHDQRPALEATLAALEHHPAAVEFIDRNVLDMTAGNIEYTRLRDFIVGDPDALLAIEFFGENRDEAVEKIARLEEDLRRRRFGYHYHRALDGPAQKRIWKLRKAGLGLLMARRGDAKPVAFVEDPAVAPERLPEFIERFLKILERHNAVAAFYGHASVGCLHIRPIINLKTEEGIRQFTAIAEEVADLVVEFGGALSAEHGDGRVRSPFMEKVFGPALCEAFAEVKRAFDPQGIFNPGVIVAPDPLTANLRFGAGYVTPEIETTLDFSSDGGIVRAAEMCSGVGVCRKRTEETMCPSFMVTGDEQHSSRGRANALRLAMTGRLGRDGLVSQEVHDALDLCLACKSCKSECPSQVDVAKLKFEFLHQYYRHRGVPLRAKLFGHIERLMALGSGLAPLSTWLVRSWPARWAMEKLFGIDRRRRLPPFARNNFLRWFAARGGRIGEIPADADPHKSVILFHDTFLTYNEPQIGIAAVQLFERLGWRVFLPDKKCCGRPMISKGLLDEAKANAAYNVERLHPLVERGFRIIGAEPSCILTFRDDYPDLLRGDLKRKAETVGAACLMIEEFLHDALEKGMITLGGANEKGGMAQSTKAGAPRRILYHGHCHQKALVGTEPAVAVLSRIPNVRVEDLDCGCCGMAGAFGYEKEHFEISRQIAEFRLLPTIRAAGDDALLVASGTSCRQQIRDLTGKAVCHPIELLASAFLTPQSADKTAN
ncbi:MAG: FAD-binding protein [Candidatus Sumerlaeia bacterium]|nr:FAD-binding protein [Candidatus Sumerlaeia bacterium]